MSSRLLKEFPRSREGFTYGAQFKFKCNLDFIPLYIPLIPVNLSQLGLVLLLVRLAFYHSATGTRVKVSGWTLTVTRIPRCLLVQARTKQHIEYLRSTVLGFEYL